MEQDSKDNIIENPLDSNKNVKYEKFKKEAIDFLKTVIIAVLVAFIIVKFIIVNAVIPTGSMKNTIMPNDRIIAFRLAYTFSEPKRNDIVVFRAPDEPETLYVKRIIGLPGETINIIDGKVYIDNNETPLDDSYIAEKMEGNFGPYTVPEGCYFMLGDNRNDSKDSRYWENKFVEKDDILGKAVFKYYPKFESLLDK